MRRGAFFRRIKSVFVSRQPFGINPRWGKHSSEARKQFFFEKKNQKTFVLLVDAADATGTSRNE